MRKLKYRRSDGEILTFGAYKTLSAGSGEKVIQDFKEKVPSPSRHYKIVNDLVKEKTAQEKADADKAYDFISEAQFSIRYAAMNSSDQKKVQEALFAIVASKNITETQLDGIIA